MKKDIHKVFIKTVKSYKAVLNQYFPSLKKNRFTERNQTFYFAHNYLNTNPDSIIWQELPIQFEYQIEEEKKIKKKAGHIDSLIIDNKNKAIIFIEAKCLSKGESRIENRLEAIQCDLERLNNIVKGNKNAGRYPQFPEGTENYTKYILILADIWDTRDGSESSKVLGCWAPKRQILWGKNNDKSIEISCSFEEIAVSKKIVYMDKNNSYNLLYRLYKT